MISPALLYPYVLVPKAAPAIWGGDALVRTYGKAGDPAATIGESWECWDANRVANGELAGETVGELRARLGSELTGAIDATRLFPILTKIIDARAALSVQVHPDDAYAQRVEGQPFGKAECWYILAADAGAELVLGWTADTTREEYVRRVADGSLGDILRRVPVHAGDVFYLPAGTMHAIGAGIQLFETQQASDLTYRIFDWNRVGPDGKPRELHVDKAADVLDYHAGTSGAMRSLAFRTGELERTLLIADEHFVVERLAVGDTPGTLATDGLPLTITALGTDIELEGAGGRTTLTAWSSAIVPAAVASVTLRCAQRGPCALVARPQPQLAATRAQALAAGSSQAAVDDFFNQFR